jgi:hypothetical protein
MGHWSHGTKVDSLPTGGNGHEPSTARVHVGARALFVQPRVLLWEKVMRHT